MRISKENYYLNIAKEIASRGTCIRRNFGSVIVKDDRIVSTGYTGAPRGRVNCCDLGTCIRTEKQIPRGERYELCIDGNTLIRLANRSFPCTIKELAENKHIKKIDVFVYAQGMIIPVSVGKPVYVGLKKTITLHFGDLSTLTCTPDHKLLLVDETYKEASRLRPCTDVVMGYRKSIKDISTNYDILDIIPKYVVRITEDESLHECYDISVPGLENFGVEICGTGSGIFVHNCRSVHSEMNAIINASKEEMKDATLYLVGIEHDSGNIVENANCCAMCKRAIINSGISKVIVRLSDTEFKEIDVTEWIDKDDSLENVVGY